MTKAKILIVEDSFIVAHHLQTTLENDGYTVMEKFDTGEAALKFVEVNRPDIVLMDIMLNGELDGIQTATHLRLNHNIPVIYITALTDKDTITRAKITEPYGYLTKPFEDREIFTVIEMALYKHDIESRLKQSEEKYFSTVNSISDSVIVIDRYFSVTFMNPTAIAVTQWTLKDAVGKSILSIVNLRNEVTGETGVNPIQCSIRSKGHNRMPDDLILISKHMTEVPIGESSLSPLLDTKGDFIGLVIVFKDMTENREHQRLMDELERHRVAAIIEGQEQERARIAKDLHDGLGQMLNAIKMNIKSLIKNNGEAASLSKLMDEAINESVRISENLLPSKLKDFSLEVCLRSLCASIGQSTGMKISFDAHDGQADLLHNQKINFYRIAQEGINNAVKHAGASAIALQFHNEKESVRLSIEDNGKGFQPDIALAFDGHNGLVNMRDRAEIMGGRFLVESDAKRGTLIVVEVPLTNLNDHAKV